MKRKVLLTLVTVLLCTILMACGKNTPEPSVDEENSSEETFDNNEETQIFDGYQELSLDKIGEYEYKQISYSDFKDNYVLNLDRVNLQSDISDNTYTLNLNNTLFKPNRFDYDYIRFDDKIHVNFDDLEFKSVWNYTPMNTDYIKSKINLNIDDIKLDTYFTENNEHEVMIAQIKLNGDTWKITNYVENGNYEKAIDEICEVFNCIEPTYDESAHLIMKVFEESLKYFSFNNIKFDFTSKQIGSLKEVEFKEDGKISKLPVLSFRNPDSTEWIDFRLALTLYNGVEYDIEEIKKETAKLFEIPLKNYNLRVYEFEDDGKSVVGFIRKGENTEYILMIDTNMSIEELEQFFRDVVVDE